MAIFNNNDGKQSGIAGIQTSEDTARHFGIPHRLSDAAAAGIRFFSRPWPKALFRIVVTAVFVYFVNRSMSADDIARLLGEVQAGPVTSAVLLGVLSFFLQMLRWQIILQSNNLPSTMGVALKTMLRGSLLAFITPGRIGELFRALHLDKMRRVTTIVAVVEERSFAVAATVVAGIVCMTLQAAVYHTPFFVPVAVASVFFCAAVLLAVAIVVLKLPIVPRRTSGVFAPGGTAATYLRHIRSLPHMRLSLLSIGAHLLLLTQTALLFRMFGSGGFSEELLVAGQAFSFMLLLPFFIANIGLREYAFALFLGRSSTSVLSAPQLQGVALGVGMSILIINIILPAIIGLVWLYTEKKTTDSRSSASPRGSLPETSANPEFHDNAS